MTFQITFRNGDFRASNLTRKELLADLRYMRSKWAGITCVISYDNVWQNYNRKTIVL